LWDSFFVVLKEKIYFIGGIENECVQ
jgi:hypothetical protein